MTMLGHTRLSTVTIACLLLAAVGQARAENLIKDGGFETPPTPSGGYTAYAPGQKIGKWLVTGSSGNVATVNNYEVGGVHWIARKGQAYIDLTGTCDCGASSGVSQTFKTVIGSTYKLTFWVGNTYIPGDGTTSAVDVYLGADKILTAVNKRGEGSTNEVWKKFTTTFVAGASSATLGFVNGDPNGDQQNGVDDVTVITE